MTVKAIILAAGKGTRMKSALPKVLHKAVGKEMVKWAMDAVAAVDKKPILVVGYGKDEVIDVVGDDALYAVQAEQKGTGHAVMMAKEHITDCDYVVITCGDMVLLRSESIEKIVDYTVDNKLDGAVLTAFVDTPFGLGRIVKDKNGNIQSIVEHKDATKEQLEINEINTGVYCYKASELLKSLDKLDCNNSQNEYYLTDVVKIISQAGGKVGSIDCDEEEALGINDKSQLAIAAKELRRRINLKHMKNGVTIIDPEVTYIDDTVVIGNDTTIYPGSVIEGNTTIGESCVIKGASLIKNAVINNNVTIKSSTIEDAKVDDLTNVGPNAYLRPNSVIGKDCKIGDFVEIKNANIGDGTKISHLTYVGDADIGKNVNLGCGVVIVNYDGKNKFRTVVEDNAFVGCNTNLVSPVKVGEGAFTAAGSTITDDIPAKALGIARSRQTNKTNWKRP